MQSNQAHINRVGAIVVRFYAFTQPISSLLVWYPPKSSTGFSNGWHYTFSGCHPEQHWLKSSVGIVSPWAVLATLKLYITPKVDPEIILTFTEHANTNPDHPIVPALYIN